MSHGDDDEVDSIDFENTLENAISVESFIIKENEEDDQKQIVQLFKKCELENEVTEIIHEEEYEESTP